MVANPSSDPPLTVEDIIQRLERIARGELSDIAPYLHEIKVQVSLQDGNGICHIHALALDGNGRVRISDLMHWMADCVLDYAIPRSAIADAISHQQSTGSTSKLVSLASEAQGLFADVANSGEGGELLLSLLAERVLKLPQLLCKMNLKTSTNMHFHGADGLHAGTGSNGKLALYWLESKVHKSLGSALKSCLDDLAKLLTNTSAHQSRDLQLLSRFIDLNDPELEDALKRFLNPENSEFNSVEYRGLALVGFETSLNLPRFCGHAHKVDNTKSEVGNVREENTSPIQR